jgi:hypothetical protein
MIVEFVLTNCRWLQMESPKDNAPIDGGAIDDRRTSVDDRRSSPRRKALRGAQILWATGTAVTWPTGAPVKCIVRNYSEKGAKIEAQGPVPGTFDLVFDLDQARRSCRVVWRKGSMIGVKFM